MKSLNIKSDEFPFQKHPMILIIGKQKYRQQLVDFLLTSNLHLSQRYGRILYFGRNTYNNKIIECDASNWIQKPQYAEIIDLFDQAKADKIVNLLVVFNLTQNLNQNLTKLMALKQTYLPGIISFFVISDNIDTISPFNQSQFTNVIVHQPNKDLSERFGVNIDKKLKQKKQKRWIILGNKISFI